MRPRVKICCIANKDEARLAISYGASALGLVSHMPSGPGSIPELLIREIARWMPPGVSSFLLTSETKAKDVIRHHNKALTTSIQLVDMLSDGSYRNIHEGLPGIKLLQVIHVVDESAIEEALRVDPLVSAILLDSGNPNLAIKELGGTGRVHDWKISRRIREQAKGYVYLAGGLNADNLAEALDTVEPFGIDVCSGVRTNGNLDERKLDQLFRVIDRY